MDATQSKMARAAFGFSAGQLAELAGIGRMTVIRFEAGARTALETQVKIEAALTKAGAKFTQREGRVTVSVPEKLL